MFQSHGACGTGFWCGRWWCSLGRRRCLSRHALRTGCGQPPWWCNLPSCTSRWHRGSGRARGTAQQPRSQERCTCRMLRVGRKGYEPVRRLCSQDACTSPLRHASGKARGTGCVPCNLRASIAQTRRASGRASVPLRLRCIQGVCTDRMPRASCKTHGSERVPRKQDMCTCRANRASGRASAGPLLWYILPTSTTDWACECVGKRRRGGKEEKKYHF